MGSDNSVRGKLRRDDSLKVPGISFSGYGEPDYKPKGFNVTAAQFQDGAASHGSKSNSRKAATAQIAKIPYPLALYIARVFKSGGELR